MVTIVFFIFATALLLASIAREIELCRVHTWRRVAHGTLGAIALALSCGTALVTTAMADEPASPVENAESATASTTDSEPTAAKVEAATTASSDNLRRLEKGDDPGIYTGPVYPADRPDWVTAPPTTEGEVDSVVVSSEPYFSRQECAQAIRAELKKATDAYVDDYLNVAGASRFVDFDVRYIEDHLVASDKTYGGPVQFSFGPMHEEYRLLRFDREFRKQLDERWREAVARNRMMKTGLGVGGLLMLLSIVFGYFKADTATRGYYSGRLQFSAAVAILAIVVAGALVAGWIPRL